MRKKKAHEVSLAPHTQGLAFVDSDKKGDTLVSQKLAANTTPDETLAPIEGFIHNRLEAYVTHNNVPTEVIEHLRQVYVMGLQDSKLTIGELEDVHA